MKKLLLLGIIILLTISITYGEVSHPASQIIFGNFPSGNYSFGGFLGIGTTSPSQRLDIQGHLSLSGSIIGRGSSYLDIYTNTSDGSDNRITRIGGGGDVLDNRGGFIELHGNEAPQTGDILLHPGTVNGNIILYTGDVGIGTTSPNNLLELAATHPSLYINGTGNSRLILDRGSVTEKSQVEFKTSGADSWYVGLADSGDLGNGSEFFIGTRSGGDGAPAIVVDTLGNVGIGVTNISSKLEVAGYIESENTFVGSQSISSGNYLTVEFGSSALGTCVFQCATCSGSAIGFYYFSVGDVIIEIDDNLGYLTATTTGSKVKFRSTSYCPTSACEYRVTCSGRDLYPATITDES